MDNNLKKMIGNVFEQMAEGLETGSFVGSIKVGITTLGSELGAEELIKGAEIAAAKSPALEAVLIGPENESGLKTIPIKDEDEMHNRMEELLDSGEIDCCVTMHYNFPIGVSTVGRVTTPGTGREMLIATTTGTSAVDRVAAMVKNAIYGIACAKAMGNSNPTLGILNVDGARQTERVLLDLNEKGYPVNFARSQRIDGGRIMRGNDLLTGTPDIMVTDTLTGNILMKIFSSYTTGGSYESMGFGYGPGVGEDYRRIILILSRASGAPVIANAIEYAAALAKGKLIETINREMASAKKAGLEKSLDALKKEKPKAEEGKGIEMPPKKVVTESISGIDIMDLDSAVEALWGGGIYAETGMGCTGPVVMVAEDELKAAVNLLEKEGYVTGEMEC